MLTRKQYAEVVEFDRRYREGTVFRSGRMDTRSTQGDERSREEMMAKVFPSALIALDVAAAVVYAACGDWRRFIYWLAAATLTATVTF